MVDINEIYKSNSDNIKAEDIGNNMWTLTIKSADVKAFDNGAERKLVLSFHEWDKNLPLNITNARAIADMYGHDSNAWAGRQIMLFAMKVDFQGKPTLGIRIRPPMQAQAPQQAPQQPYQPPQGGYPAPLQNSPQRPLNQPQMPQQTYQQASGGNPAQMFNPPAPPPTDNPFDGV